MKKFKEFFRIRENGILNVDVPDNIGKENNIMRALSLANLRHHQETMSFLTRLAKQDPDIQIELDKFNHVKQQEPPKKLRMGSGLGHERGDEVVPNNADSASGDSMPD